MAKAETSLQYWYKCSKNWFKVQLKKKTVYRLTVEKSGTNSGKRLAKVGNDWQRLEMIANGCKSL